MVATDGELIQRCREKDLSALGELFHRYQEKIYNLAYRIMGSREDAEDLVQDVFVKVYESAEQYQEKASFSTWLYRVAVNLSIDRLRKKKRERLDPLENPDTEEDVSLIDALPADDPSPEELAIAREKKERIQSVLEEVDSRYRTIIILRDLEALSYSEIAAILGCSIGTVRSRLHRGRRLLKEKFKKLGEW